MRWLLSYGRGTQDIERVTLRIKTNSSGDIYLPTAWYSITGTQDCPYNWYVSIDGWEDTTYAGTGSSSWAIRVWYWLRPWTIHTVTIKPVVDDFLWCRALGYKGSAYAPYLINIISDKSYKGYAFNEIFSWDYYKAYQYQWCTNLLNTDDELLPNTLEIIGSNYRAYEYAGCTSLKNNAEEKILKSVKCIWDNYRAYQYQNCTSINKIWIRAINWSSVGSNYRIGMFSWACSTANPANITIEWGICEGGSWWLVDNRVKTIKVYSWLVNDYKALLTWITSTKISANPIWDTNDYEFIEFIALADSNWEIRIPVGWFSTAGEQDCSYDWNISIDWWNAESYSWTGSNTYFSIGSWLTEGSEHRIIIKPNTVSFWWGRAFWYFGTWAEGYIKEFIHDSFKCFWATTTSTGDYYKFNAFRNCTNLINTYEKLPTTVNTIGLNFMRRCYDWCTSLTSAFWEVLHSWTTIWDNYRYQCFKWCSSLALHQWMAWYTWGTYPTNYKREMFDWAWNNLVMYITRLEKMYTDMLNASTTYWTWTSTLATLTTSCVCSFSWEIYSQNSNCSYTFTLYQNWASRLSKSLNDRWTVPFSVDLTCNSWDVISITASQYQSYGLIRNMKLEYTKVLWLDNSRVSRINIFVDDLYYYTGANPWKSVSASKFRFYYFDYKPIPAPDLTKYTTLIGSYSMPTRERTNSYSYYIWWWYEYAKWFSSSKWGTHDVRVPWERYILSDGRVLWETYRIRWEWATNWVAIDTWETNDYWTWTWGSIDGNVRWFNEDYKWGMSIASAYESSSWVVYKEIDWRPAVARRNEHFDWWYAVFASSRDWRWVWAENTKYYAPTKWWTANVNVWTYSWSFTNIEFSDDWLTAYCASNFWTITQYNLSAPRDLNTRTSTWKTKSVNWGFALSKDYKYLYVYNWTLTVYQYTE